MTQYDNTIVLENDTIQLLFNSELTIRPYLMRLKNDTHEMYEMRFSEQELEYFSQWIIQSIRSE